MLEDELVHLLSADGEVRELLLVDGMQALSLSAKLKAQSHPHPHLGQDLGAMLKGTVMTKVARIDTGLCFEPGFDEKVDGFAREFCLQRIELPGGTALAEGCYERAKSSLAARPGSAPPDARTRSPHFKGCLEAMLAICRMTRKKFQGE
jgi:hypothetical protein